MRDHVLPDLVTKQDFANLRAETHQCLWQAALVTVLGIMTLISLIVL